MRIVVIEPGHKPKVQEIDGTVEEMQEIVGGMLQAMYPFSDIALVFNADAKVLHLSPNRGVQYEDKMFCDIVCGTFFLCGASEDSNYFTSLTVEQIQQYTEIFASPEVFLNLGGRTIILPCAEIKEDSEYESASVYPQPKRHET